MRRVLVLALPSLLVASGGARAEPAAEASAGAAIASEPRLTVGASAGAGFIGLHGELTIEAGPLSQEVSPRSSEGFLGGGYAELTLIDWLGLRLEALYAYERAGGELQVPVDTSGQRVTTLSYEYRRHGLEVPILAVARLPYDARFAPRVFAGPYLAFPLSTAIHGSGTIQFPLDDQGEPIMDEVQYRDESVDLGEVSPGVQVGAVAGAGMSFPLPVGRLVGQVRYHAGITDAVDAHEATFAELITFRGEGLRERGLALMLSYQI